ncbi:MAG TPA: VOC family protein [Candidatus Binataceae bacterium]
MATKVSPIPPGASRVSPYLSVKNAPAMIDFYKKAFGAAETMRLKQPDGRIGHAEITIGGASIMLADEFPEMGFLSPNSIGARSPVAVHLYVEDVDAVYKPAIAAGAVSTKEPTDEFFGERNAHLTDPSGHAWFLSSRIEEVSPAEMQKRFDAMMKQEG